MPAPAVPLALELRGVEKRFSAGLLRRPHRVLDEIDLALAPGACLGLVGPNGSGKSTLLRIAAGVERASAGEVRLFGRGTEDPGARGRVGWLGEESPFPAELSARSVLELLAALHGMPRRERRRTVGAMLARVGLERRARSPLGRFSHGMLRRLGLAAAFLARPDLVLLDEPTAGLDAEGHVVLEELLDEARGRGAALFIATHVVADLSGRCAATLVVVGGRIVATLATAELARDPGRLLGIYASSTGVAASGSASYPNRLAAGGTTRP